jgi:Tfp pilus assembly protein PilE
MTKNKIQPMHVVLAVIAIVFAIGFLGYSKTQRERAAAAEQLKQEQIAAERQRQAENQRLRQEQQDYELKLAQALEAQAKEVAQKQLQREQADAALKKMKIMVERFDDTTTLANSTARIALAQPVATLQRIKRETESIEVPSCLEGSKGSLVSAMNDYITGYLAFMTYRGQQAEDAAKLHFANASTHLQNSKTRVNRCKE